MFDSCVLVVIQKNVIIQLPVFERLLNLLRHRYSIKINMYRTDKQFMTNPATASSRIYIGGLAKTIVAADLEEKFKLYGKILGLVLQMGFAFIQYESDSQAQAAIKNENNTIVHGRKICVRQALDKSQKGANQNQRRPNQNQPMHPNQPPFYQNNQNQMYNQHNPPYNQNQQFNPQNPAPQVQNQSAYNQNNQTALQKKPPPQQQNYPEPKQSPLKSQPQQNQSQGFPETVAPPHLQIQKDSHQKGIQQPPPQSLAQEVEEAKPTQKPEAEQETSQPSVESAPQGPPTVGPINDEVQKKELPLDRRGRKRRMRSRDRFPQPVDVYRDDGYFGRDDYPHSSGAYGGRPPVLDQPDRNDCEIIVVAKSLTKYAEYIEQRLKSLGLIVDLLFPNEDVPIGRVLANISSRGCLYAILVMPQNEEHRSLTLNVLHGLPQEHRNMPIEDALILIMRNFDAYMRGDKTAVETLGPGGVLNVSDRHPTSMQLLLNLLAENRQLTSTQYDRLLKYLQDRREVQQQHESAEGVDNASQESNSKQAELQSRIMNILNKASNDNSQPPPETPQDVAPPLLKDPSVQKALDSLLGGEMFKNIGVAL